MRAIASIAFLWSLDHNMEKPNKRVLIITYYWPPSGGSGVQRWLKFAKYLPENGWQPIIYTPENPEYPSIDYSLEADIPISCEVIKRKIFEPYGLYKKFVGMKKEERINTGFLSDHEKPGILEKISRWLRGNFFIPDARKFWIRPSIRFLKNYLKDHPVDVIISSGPPHSMHLIARGLKRSLGVRWIADFRDPWTNIDFYEDLMLSSMADRRHHRLEASVLEECDTLLVVGNTMKKEFTEMVDASKIEVIPNGFDADDFADAEVSTLDANFTIAHIGSFSPARNVPALWEALANKCETDANFANKMRLKIVGNIDHSVKKSIDAAGLTEKLLHIPYLPHSEVMLEQRKSHLLLLIVNRSKNAEGIVTGKVFEYLASERPILAVGPPGGDLDHLLKRCGHPGVIHYDDQEGFLAALSLEQKSLTISSFNRSNLTKELSRVLG